MLSDDETWFSITLFMQVLFLEATALLLAHNAPVKSKNKEGWNSLMEAVSYGDRPTSEFISC